MTKTKKAASARLRSDDGSLHLPQLVRKYAHKIKGMDGYAAGKVLFKVFKGRYKKTSIITQVWRERRKDRRAQHLVPVKDAVDAVRDWATELRREFDLFEKRYNKDKPSQDDSTHSIQVKGKPPDEKDDADSFVKKNLKYVQNETTEESSHMLFELCSGEWTYHTIHTHLGRARRELERENSALGALGKKVNESRQAVKTLQSTFVDLEERYNWLTKENERLGGDQRFQRLNNQKLEALRACFGILRMVTPPVHKGERRQPMDKDVMEKAIRGCISILRDALPQNGYPKRKKR